MDNLFEKTAQLYQSKIDKPKVTAKLLQKPPFRFLHDIVMALMVLTGFPEHTFSEDECNSVLVAQSSEKKISFLTKLIEKVSGKLGVPVDLKPSKVVAGLEPEKTCLFLGALFKAATGETFKEGVVEKMSENHIFKEEEGKKDGQNLDAVKCEVSLQGVRIQEKVVKNKEKKVTLEKLECNRIAVEEEIKENFENIGIVHGESEKNSELTNKYPSKFGSKNIKTKRVKKINNSSDLREVSKNETSKPSEPNSIIIPRKSKNSRKDSSSNPEDLKSLQLLIQSLCTSTTSLSKLIEKLPSTIHSQSKESSHWKSQSSISQQTPIQSDPIPILAELDHEIKETQLKILQVKGKIQKNSLIIKNFNIVDYLVILIWRNPESKTSQSLSGSVH